MNTWPRGCTTGAAPRPRERQVPAGDCHTVLEERRRAQSRFGWPENTRVVRCYEAGRDGFGLHRFFVAHGVENRVVDSASLEVHRRHRRAQTDRLEVHTLLLRLLRHEAGAKKVWSVVRVPSVADADRRQLHRAWRTTKRDRPRVLTRIKGLLAGYGVRMALQGDVEAQLEQGRPWDGSPLPPALRARLTRAWQTVCCLTEPIRALEAERRAALHTSAEPAGEQVRQWATLRGSGVKSAWLCAMACFAWRDVQTPQQVDA